MHDNLTDIELDIGIAERSIHQVHALIHTVFTQPSGAQAALQALLPQFSPEFSMVTTTGRLVGLKDVEQMFQSAAGQRPGLEMSVSDVQPVWRDPAGLALRYRETPRLDGVETSRRSVVILQRAGQGVLWRYLHETALG
jgi:hypothetical protein